MLGSLDSLGKHILQSSGQTQILKINSSTYRTHLIQLPIFNQLRKTILFVTHQFSNKFPFDLFAHLKLK